MFGQKCLDEFEAKYKNCEEITRTPNFIEILFNNQDVLTKREMRDEVCTLIMAVSINFVQLLSIYIQ